MKLNQRQLTEAYAKRLSVTEAAYQNIHNGSSLPEHLKNATAQLMSNTNTLFREALSNSTGVQLGDMGTFKKFTLDIVQVALPNLIAPELVITRPMASRTGFIQYIQFVASSAKGGIKQGDVFNDPFHLGEMTDERVDYTSQAVAEIVKVGEDGTAKLAWTPISAAFKPELVGAESGATIEVVDAATGEVRIEGATGDVKVKYLYDQVRIPANDIPTIGMRVQGLALEAKPRRIAIYFDQMAAFQAKTEMGIDMADVLAKQAVSEISYEIDTEVVKLLATSAPVDETLKFNKRPIAGISLAEHYEAFAETIGQASRIIYDRTKKYAANYMVCASNVIPMLSLMRGWKAAASGVRNGPYLAGNLNGLKVFVSPALEAGKWFVGYNGDDLMTSAAIFAPYMPIAPTALLNFADGGNSQGFMTLYDLKLLNPILLVAGEVIDEKDVNATQVLPTAEVGA